MGVFDVPAPLFAWVDQVMSGVAPPTLRLIVWGLVAAVLSMGLYWMFSPQHRLTDVKIRAAKAREDLNAFDGEFGEAWPLMQSMLSLSFRQLTMTTMPALLASIPVLMLIVWLSTAYGYAMPDGQSRIEVETTPNTAVLAKYQSPDGPVAANHPRLIVTNVDGDVVGDIALAAPVPTIHKKQWWNRLIGNPLGYLPADSDIDAIEIDLPERDYLGFGPSWLRPWYVLFFTILVVGSLAIKMAFRIT